MRSSASFLAILVALCTISGCNLPNRSGNTGNGSGPRDGGSNVGNRGSTGESNNGGIDHPKIVETTESGYGTEDSDEIPGDSVTSLKVRTGRGTVTIIGDASARSITARATLESRAENVREAKRILSEIPVRFVSSGTENPALILNEPNLSDHQDYSCNVTITLPPTIRVSLDNTGGDVNIASLESGLAVNHSGGHIKITNVRGGVELTSTGAGAELQDLSGLVSINDGAGSLMVQLVTGEVQIDDASGVLQVRFITGNVTARNNTGKPEFQNIDGDLTLVDIVHNNAKVQGVLGKVSYPSGD